ncbi:MAG: metal ABC transporter ATP-binding protein [Anaerolineae bacterium]|nr:metal ABC transporter ATP-binding protein [Anaerolineae bacterium]
MPIGALVRSHAQHRDDSPILEVQDASVAYDGRLALEGVSFRLDAGERVAVVGPNGAGKSTLFKAIVGVLPPASGQIRVAGHGPGGHICIAYVPQRSHVDWSFPVNVADVVMMGRVGKLGWLRRPRQRDWDHVRHCLDVVCMGSMADRQIGELSGGQQQRMFIARALAQEAALMLMDEPLIGLDIPSQEDIFHILDVLREQRVTVLVAIHDLNLAAERFDRVMLLKTRLLGFGKPHEVFTPQRLQAAYGSQLHLIEGENGLMALSDTCCGGDL